MAYVQPNADGYVQSGYDFFRIRQQLETAGDIFESPQGAAAFALGPDSDISQVTIGYLDPQAQPTFDHQTAVASTFLSTFTLSPQRSFDTLIPAINGDGSYAPGGGVPGRILIWPTEIYNSTYLPRSFNPDNDTLVFERPTIDIIQYYKPPSTGVPQRGNKSYYYDSLPFGTDDCFVLIPYYGRRYASFFFHNPTADNNLDVTVRGVNFRFSESVNGQEVTLFSMTLGFGESKSRVITSAYEQTALGGTTPTGNAGMFDYLLIQLSQNLGEPANAVLRVLVSDTVY